MNLSLGHYFISVDRMLVVVAYQFRSDASKHRSKYTSSKVTILLRIAMPPKQRNTSLLKHNFIAWESTWQWSYTEHKHMVRPASDTYYVTVGTILMNLGVPSKLIGCIPKVADRYTTPLATVTWGITFKTSAYAHDARDERERVCMLQGCRRGWHR